MRKIWRRKRQWKAGEGLGERPTAILSLNRFVVIFLAYFSFFSYGVNLEPFNHYLAWPRAVAMILALLILWEIRVDRRNTPSEVAFWGCAAATTLGVGFLLMGPKIAVAGRMFSVSLMMVVMVLLIQSYAHQVLLIRRSGRTGAISLKYHQLTCVKEFSTMAFGVAMGLAAGWPILLMSTASLFNHGAVIWHFRWVRLSPKAERRRAASVS